MTQQHELKLSEIRSLLPKYIDEKRLSHTLGVYREALWMAKIFNLSEEETFELAVAALLHDIAKNLTSDEISALAEKQGVTVDMSIPPVTHQYTGAMLARELFGETVTARMYNAIACHTTGKGDMTPFDMMLFTADFTEAGRKYRTCIEFREYLHDGCEKINKNEKNARLCVLREVTRRIIGYTISYRLERGGKIAPAMLEAWNSMV